MDVHDNAVIERRTSRSRLGLQRPPVLITLLVIAFGLGALASWLFFIPRDTDSPQPGLQPGTATPLPPTRTPALTPTATSPEVGDLLDTLYLEIAPDDLAQIEAKRAEALERWILLTSDTDFVPATLRLNEGEPMEAEVRLKGDWADHLAFDKWSFRVELENDLYLYGMSVFSLQDPSMRTYLNEWLFLENLRAEDVLSVHYYFVRVVLNGEYKGIYGLEESFAKELLESQRRREGPIIRYDENLLWTARAFYDDQTLPASFESFYIIDEFQSGRIDRSPLLSAQRDAAVGLLRGLWTGDLSGQEVFALEELGTFLALTDLWSAPHGLIWHNLRYYYNPVTTRLEPIAFDTDPFSPELDFDLVGLEQQHFYHDPYVQRAYVEALWRVSEPGYVESLAAVYGPRFEALRVALGEEFEAEVLQLPWDLLIRRQELIRQRLQPQQMVYAYVPVMDDRRQTMDVTRTLTLEVGNLMDLPVEVVGLEFGVDGEYLSASNTWATSEDVEYLVPPPLPEDALVLRPLPADASSLPYVRLEIPDVVAGESPSMTLLTRVWGLTETLRQPVIPRYPLPLEEGPIPAWPAVEEALEAHPYLEEVEGEQALRIQEGTWDVIGDLVLPRGYGLYVEGGTTLRFGPENFLLAGGPLLFEGTEVEPVLLQPTGETWRGVVVLEAGAPSLWRHVTVEDTDAIDRDGWTLTGGITFYESDVRLEWSRILGTRAEDAINVIRARFEFVDSEFAETASDAFDADFAQGLVARCFFRDVAADGIDVSGADVEVREVRLVNLGDKGLSVGEASRLTAMRISVSDAKFGVVSKDLSQVTVDELTLEGIRVAGLSAYIKKPAYGPASIVAEDVTFVDVPAERRTLVQTGSWIDLEGERVWGTEVDVEALYP